MAASDSGRQGMLVPIGGGEGSGGSRTGDPGILGHFVWLAGGRKAELVVIPTASSLADTGERYRATFLHLGAREVHLLRPKDREAADHPDAAALIRRASGVFFTGGDQLRLAKRLGGTALADAIRAAHSGGIPVAGTSAGASFLSARMIAFGKSGSTPRPDMVYLADGLGLTSHFLIDQHFHQRNRLGRILAALVASPEDIGLGLDEDTAAFIGPDSLEVMGNGAITVVDAQCMKAYTLRRAGRHDPISMTNLHLHVLGHGATFHIERRVAAPPPAPNREPT